MAKLVECLLTVHNTLGSFHLQHCIRRVRWQLPVIPELWMQRQEEEKEQDYPQLQSMFEMRVRLMELFTQERRVREVRRRDGGGGRKGEMGDQERLLLATCGGTHL